jgi:5'-deoxynucleotidase YfbR-like HD superfamily hydrolase
MNLKSVLEIITFTNAFRSIDRDLFLIKQSRLENDVEHSFQLALLVWYLSEGTELKKEKLLKYALAHDLVETYAGDSPPFSSTESHLQSKDGREQSALEKIESDFSSFSDLAQALHAYEEKKDPESRFVYVIDKIMPILNELTFGEIVYYKKNGVTFEKWKAWLKKKMESVSFENSALIEELLIVLEKNKEGIFANEKI